MFFFFTAKPYTMQMKLETMTEIQEAKDESEAGSMAIYKVSSLLDIAMGMYMNHQLEMTQCPFSKNSSYAI